MGLRTPHTNPTRKRGNTSPMRKRGIRRFPMNSSLARRRRKGSASIDYFLLLGTVLPLAAFMMQIAPRMMRSVYDLLTVIVAWPFL